MVLRTAFAPKHQIKLGASYLGDGKYHFRVWAPLAHEVDVHFLSPQEGILPMRPTNRGYFEGIINDLPVDTLYQFRLDRDKEYPDPASRYQPQGVLGPSQVVSSTFTWEDNSWFGIPLQDYIIYELHVGTFSPEGTFEAVIPYLEKLVSLGITAVELMPVAQFSGSRNWGYDGVYPFSVQNSYGGVEGLKRLVNACHNHNLAVVLDVVYNHMGPEGCFLQKFGPYYTERYKTAWGQAINFDGPGSDEVRRFFIQNALYWITEFHIDALRLDAVHTILDFSPRTFLEDLAEAVKCQADHLNRRKYLFVESDANDERLVRSPDLGGYGLDAVWNDDFHHALHTLLTGEKMGYYQDYNHLRYLVAAMKEGFAYSGEYSSFWERRRGSSSRSIPSYRLVVFSQNHDQIGNRMLGERLSQLVSFESQKLASSAVLLSPYIPLLFMGEEYGEIAPFPYFISHSDPGLIEKICQGRAAEFAGFRTGGSSPDPQSEDTFRSARLNHQLSGEGLHHVLLEFYQEVIHLRKTIPALTHLNKECLDVLEDKQHRLIFLKRWFEDSEIVICLNFEPGTLTTTVPLSQGIWYRRLDSSDKRWMGEGSLIPEELHSEGNFELTLPPRTAVLLEKANSLL